MMMKRFIVEVREVHVQPFEVEANSKEEAIEIIRDGGEGLSFTCL